MTNSKKKIHHRVIVIGSGPSGLGVASSLEMAQVDYLILEKGNEPFFSWVQMPDSLVLLSRKELTKLNNHRNEFYTTQNLYLSKFEFIEYMQNFFSFYSLKIKTSSEVLQVTYKDSLFHIETDRRLYTADFLVNCTGYFSAPRYPFNIRNSDNVIHYANLKNIQNIKSSYPDAENVLIVGKRISAGHMIKLFYENGFKLSISSESPIQFTPVKNPWRLLFNLYFYFKILLEKYFKVDFNETAPRMLGDEARKYLESGEIAFRPKVREIKGSQVTFIDGSILEYDLVVLATGFNYTHSHLDNLADFDLGQNFKYNRTLVHPKMENLFLLGMELQVDPLSRFLVGIKRDAKTVANAIIKRVKYDQD